MARVRSRRRAAPSVAPPPTFPAQRGAQLAERSSRPPRAKRWPAALAKRQGPHLRVLNVPPDVFDLRDRIYDPGLDILPRAVDQRERIPRDRIRDQGADGACTGFAMAAVVDFLFLARGLDFTASPRFLYENAKRYDEWKGQDYDGSSLRGAMKGFLKHGVCSEQTLPFVAGERLERIPLEALEEADNRPLGAYYRVRVRSVNEMQSAIHEVGIVLASARVHPGWLGLGAAGSHAPAVIPWRPGDAPLGGHAFAIVGYDEIGFLVQNSWGREWGSGGFARITYPDWLANGMDAWVAQIGVGRVSVTTPASSSAQGPGAAAPRVPEQAIRGHYLAIENGDFARRAIYPSTLADLDLIADGIRDLAGGSRRARVLLWAHGGLTPEDEAARRTLDLTTRFLPLGVYPLQFIWHTAFLEEVSDLLIRKHDRTLGPAPGAVGEGWIDRIDEAIEVLARPIGRPIWREMKRDASRATAGRGGALGPAGRLLDAIVARGIEVEFHLAGHSAGAVFLSLLVPLFAERGLEVRSLSLIAPAATTALFRARVIPHAGATVKAVAIHTMTDRDEQDDHVGNLPLTGVAIYHKSLLYLMSNSFEELNRRRLLGLARDIDPGRDGRRAVIARWVKESGLCELVYRRPDRERPTDTLHGVFDRDPETLRALEERIAK